MPRRGSIAKRDVLPDPVYNSKLVTRLINNIMYDGKRVFPRKSSTVRSISSVTRQAKTRLRSLSSAWKTLCLCWR